MSYKPGCHPMFPYSEDDKQAIRKELGLTDNIIEEDIDAILEWFGKQPHLIAAGLPDRYFVEQMLLIAKGSREKTKKKIDNLYKYRGLAPELIQNRAEYIHSNNDLFKFYNHTATPKLYDLKRVSVVKFTDTDPNSIDTEVLMKNCLMFGDIRLHYDYILGDIWILDLTHTSLGHLLRMNPTIFAKATRMLSDALTIRIFGIHILGAPSFAPQLLAFFSKFVKPKIMDRLVLHKNVEDLYKYVPKEYLPQDYGGEQLSMKASTDKYTEIFKEEETKQLMEVFSKQVSDESRRPDSIYDEECINGTFKKLQLD